MALASVVIVAPMMIVLVGCGVLPQQQVWYNRLTTPSHLSLDGEIIRWRSDLISPLALATTDIYVNGSRRIQGFSLNEININDERLAINFRVATVVQVRKVPAEGRRYIASEISSALDLGVLPIMDGTYALDRIVIGHQSFANNSSGITSFRNHISSRLSAITNTVQRNERVNFMVDYAFDTAMQMVLYGNRLYATMIHRGSREALFDANFTVQSNGYLFMPNKNLSELTIHLEGASFKVTAENTITMGGDHATVLHASLPGGSMTFYFDRVLVRR